MRWSYRRKMIPTFSRSCTFDQNVVNNKQTVEECFGLFAVNWTTCNGIFPYFYILEL